MTVPSLRLMMVKGGWSSVHALTFTWSKSKSLKAHLVFVINFILLPATGQQQWLQVCTMRLELRQEQPQRYQANQAP